MKAKKSLGQNFLINKGTLNKIINAANIEPNDHVIEIGPGHGVLTKELVKQAKNVTTIELDDRLIPELEETFKDTSNIKICHQDALDFTPPKTPYKLVANIPYYITSPILNHFLREQPQKQRPTHLVLLVQREVAQKICASDGDLSVLALQVQLFGKPKIITKVPPTHFRPAPKVDSAILRITPHAPLIQDKDIPSFFTLIHAGFAHKRKKLIRNLEKIPNITKETLNPLFESLNLDSNIRAQELTLTDWLNLLRELTKTMN
jgi:16S rRNA (adenine1518-N6/adenine1519-N6)-dimethyltransferase